MGGLESPPVLDREIRCSSFELALGSSAVISACAYASLGGSARLAGLAGQDDYGEFMLRGLEEFGVDTSLVERTSSVRTGVTVNLVYGSTRTQITYPGAIEQFDGSQLTAAAFDGLQHVHFAGIYQQTKLRSRLTHLLKLAVERGITTSLDPQWDATGRWEGMQEWLPLLSYLFVNEQEACSIAGVTTAEEAAERLARLTSCPLVKAGARGAYAILGGRVTRVPTYKVHVVDTVGAGDCFNAGFLYAVIEDAADLLTIVAFANATAARSCEFAGGTAARSTRADVLAVMRREYEQV